MAGDISSVSAGLDTLLQSTEPYSATAPISDGVIDAASTALTGDYSTDLFSKTNELGKNEFLNLLVTQLQYQDPLDPMDNTEFISQLAQFTALENSTNVETAITKLGESFQGSVDAQMYSAQSMNNTAAVSLIGKDVCMEQKSVSWYGSAGEAVDIKVQLGNNESAVMELLDSDGTVVKTLEATGKNSENSTTVVWDGTTDEGGYAASGSYTIRFQNEETITGVYAFQQDVVEGVRFSPDGAMVKISGQEISIGNVLDVSIGNGGSSGGGNSLSPSTAVSLLGKQVRMRQSTVQFNQRDNEVATIRIAGGARDYVQLELTDGSGTTVLTRSVPVGDDGIAVFDWNGETDEGTYADAGSYTIHLFGESSDASLYAYTEGIVSGIANLNSDTRLRVGSYTVPISNIIDIADISESDV